MDEAKKAGINAFVRSLKQSKKENEAKKDIADSISSKVSFQVSSKPEKIMIGLGFASALAILFDDSKKRAKHPQKARPFYRRVYDNYRRLDSLLDRTIAKGISQEKKREFKDDKLEKMEIEQAYDFEI